MNSVSAPPEQLQHLAESLWDERHVVSELLYRMTCARLLLAADQHRFVASAVDEVDEVTRRLASVEARRQRLVEDLAGSLRIHPSDLTLGELAERTDEPWRSVFRDHRRAFLELAREIDETATANRSLAGRALANVRATIEQISGGPTPATTYDAAGRQAPVTTAPLRLDRVL